MNNQEQKTVPEQVLEQPITPQEPIKKPKPKWLILVIVIVGVIALSLIVWGAYELFKPAPSEEGEGIEEEEELLEDETAGWKTYSDDVYLFSFKMPPDWHGGPSRQEFAYSFESPGFDPGQTPGGQINISPLKQNVSKNLNMKEIEEIAKTSYLPDSGDLSFTIITFANREALLVKIESAYHYISYAEGVGVPIQHEIILVQNDDILWDIGYKAWDRTEDENHFWNIAQKIISTFELLKSGFDVISVEPTPGSIVERIDVVKATFNTELDPDTINKDNFYIEGSGLSEDEVFGKISYDKDKLQVIFTPDQPIIARAPYDKILVYLIIRGGIEGVKDKNGKPFAGIKMYQINLVKSNP